MMHRWAPLLAQHIKLRQYTAQVVTVGAETCLAASYIHNPNFLVFDATPPPPLLLHTLTLPAPPGVHQQPHPPTLLPGRGQQCCRPPHGAVLRHPGEGAGRPAQQRTPGTAGGRGAHLGGWRSSRGRRALRSSSSGGGRRRWWWGACALEGCSADEVVAGGAGPCTQCAAAGHGVTGAGGEGVTRVCGGCVAGVWCAGGVGRVRGGGGGDCAEALDACECGCAAPVHRLAANSADLWSVL